MLELDLPLSRKDLRAMPADFRIEAIVSDGMWYTITKWRNLSKVSEEELMDWIEEHLKDGTLVQSSKRSGGKSFRMPLSSIEKWYEKYGLEIGDQLLDFIYPARVWDGMTEVEGFDTAPLREIGIVTFSCSSKTFKKVEERLRGIARVRESSPRVYRAYCLSASYVKDLIQEVYDEEGEKDTIIRARGKSMRREMVDLSEEFSKNFVDFYTKYGKNAVRGHQETIDIYLPDQFDQESQMVVWVIEALEKFNQAAAVPFSGYFSNVMGRWPYDLPTLHLGSELSQFQRARSQAINKLEKEHPGKEVIFTSEQIAEQMGWSIAEFNDLEAKHRFWIKTRNATTLTWVEGAEERESISSLSNGGSNLLVAKDRDTELAHLLSKAILDSAIETGKFNDALSVISQLDVDSIDFSILGNLDKDFVKNLGERLSIENERSE